MSDSTISINVANRLSGMDMSSAQQPSPSAKPVNAIQSSVTADAQVTLSTTARIQAMSRTGAGVGQLAAMFQMPVSSVQDDLGMFPISTRTTIKSAPIADPNNPQQTQAHVDKPEEADHNDAHVKLSTTSQVQSMSQSGADSQQIAATLGLTLAQVYQELGVAQTSRSQFQLPQNSGQQTYA